jgi:SAM-dependent methyltransferase
MKHWRRDRPEIKVHPNLPSHLGGHLYMDNTDTYILKYCKQNLQINSIIDVGCGLGRQVELALDLGLRGFGIDGDFSLKYEEMKDWISPVEIVIHDFSEGAYDLKEICDLALSVEFLEHIEEKYLENVFSVFQRCRYVFVASAGVGQPGHHHVNCQDHKYWIEKFKEYNFNLSEDITNDLRSNSSLTATKQRGLFFINKSLIL